MSVQPFLDLAHIHPPVLNQTHKLFGLNRMSFGYRSQGDNFLHNERQVFRAGCSTVQIGVQGQTALDYSAVSLFGLHEGIMPCLC